MTFNFDFNLQAWVKNLEIEADSEEEALEILKDMSIEDIADEGFVRSIDFTDIDVTCEDCGEGEDVYYMPESLNKRSRKRKIREAFGGRTLPPCVTVENGTLVFDPACEDELDDYLDEVLSDGYVFEDANGRNELIDNVIDAVLGDASIQFGDEVRKMDPELRSAIGGYVTLWYFQQVD